MDRNCPKKCILVSEDEKSSPTFNRGMWSPSLFSHHSREQRKSLLLAGQISADPYTHPKVLEFRWKLVTDGPFSSMVTCQ